MSPPRRSPRAAPIEHIETLAFISHAIVRHAAVRARDGLPIPALALVVARWCANAARGGQDGQPFAIPDGDTDIGVMAQLLLSDKDAAALLGLSARTIRAMMADGRLPAIKVGGSTRIRRVDLDLFISSQPPVARFREDVEVKTGDLAGGAT